MSFETGFFASMMAGILRATLIRTQPDHENTGYHYCGCGGLRGFWRGVGSNNADEPVSRFDLQIPAVIFLDQPQQSL